MLCFPCFPDEAVCCENRVNNFYISETPAAVNLTFRTYKNIISKIRVKLRDPTGIEYAFHRPRFLRVGIVHLDEYKQS